MSCHGQHRDDFGVSLRGKSCSICFKWICNRGCSRCSQRLCERHFAEHVCSQSVSVTSDTHGYAQSPPSAPHLERVQSPTTQLQPTLSTRGDLLPNPGRLGVDRIATNLVSPTTHLQPTVSTIGDVLPIPGRPRVDHISTNIVKPCVPSILVEDTTNRGSRSAEASRLDKLFEEDAWCCPQCGFTNSDWMCKCEKCDAVRGCNGAYHRTRQGVSGQARSPKSHTQASSCNGNSQASREDHFGDKKVLDEDTWCCPQCKFMNHDLMPKCEKCDAIRDCIGGELSTQFGRYEQARAPKSYTQASSSGSLVFNDDTAPSARQGMQGQWHGREQAAKEEPFGDEKLLEDNTWCCPQCRFMNCNLMPTCEKCDTIRDCSVAQHSVQLGVSEQARAPISYMQPSSSSSHVCDDNPRIMPAIQGTHSQHAGRNRTSKKQLLGGDSPPLDWDSSLFYDRRRDLSTSKGGPLCDDNSALNSVLDGTHRSRSSRLSSNGKMPAARGSTLQEQMRLEKLFEGDSWVCSLCRFMNSDMMPKCERCEGPRAFNRAGYQRCNDARLPEIRKVAEQVFCSPEDSQLIEQVSSGADRDPAAETFVEECCICMEHVADGVILPCGHQCACFSCLEKIKSVRASIWSESPMCPICRGPLNSISFVASS